MATENEQLSTWLPPTLASEVREQAKREGRSVSQMIKWALEQYLASLSKAAA